MVDLNRDNAPEATVDNTLGIISYLDDINQWLKLHDLLTFPGAEASEKKDATVAAGAATGAGIGARIVGSCGGVAGATFGAAVGGVAGGIAASKSYNAATKSHDTSSKSHETSGKSHDTSSNHHSNGNRVQMGNSNSGSNKCSSNKNK